MTLPPPGPWRATTAQSRAVPLWYVGALQSIVNVSKISVNPKCQAKNPSAPHLCLFAAEALPFVQTPLFAVNQMVSVWDAQCLAEGQPSGNILQVWSKMRLCFWLFWSVLLVFLGGSSFCAAKNHHRVRVGGVQPARELLPRAVHLRAVPRSL